MRNVPYYADAQVVGELTLFARTPRVAYVRAQTGTEGQVERCCVPLPESKVVPSTRAILPHDTRELVEHRLRRGVTHQVKEKAL